MRAVLCHIESPLALAQSGLADPHGAAQAGLLFVGLEGCHDLYATVAIGACRTTRSRQPVATGVIRHPNASRLPSRESGSNHSRCATGTRLHGAVNRNGCSKSKSVSCELLATRKA